MADKRNKRLTREGEPSQKTEKGLEIPVSTPLSKLAFQRGRSVTEARRYSRGREGDFCGLRLTLHLRPETRLA